MTNINNKKCDCHFHVFGPDKKYPYAKGRSYTPKDATLDDFFYNLKKNDIKRAVIIQPSVYNFDNSATIDALKEKPNSLRAIVVIEDTHDFEELKRWNEYGVRGVRVNLLFNSGINFHHIKKLAKLIKPLNWHLQLLINVSNYDNLYDEFKDIEVDIVFDHMGHFDIKKGIKQKGFQNMLQLLRENKAWVKLSGAYRVTNESYPPYKDVISYAKEIIKANPNRVVWGSDWPHPSISTPTPNYDELVNLLDLYTNNENIKEKIMSINPNKLYDFN